jgi:flagellar assembly factor FliW
MDAAPSEPGDRNDPLDDLPVLEMVQPMAGFPDQRRFALARLDDTGLVCDLHSLDDPGLRFVVVPPTTFFADYAPEIGDSVVTELGVESEDDVLALVVVTLGDRPEDATANLMAPVLVNHRTRRAGQFLLDDADLPLRAPLASAGRG